MVDSFDVAIVGGGILGLATAREVLRRVPSTRVIVLEAEQALATHQTGRNSGVIHSGVYYTPGSAKARFCVEGARELVAFCAEHGIPHALIGKLIVAVEEAELGRLEELQRRARANGVEGTAMLDRIAIRGIEPHVEGIAALHVPGTGIVDFGAVARTFAAMLARAGAEIRCGARVSSVRADSRRVVAVTSAGTVECERLIACAGIGNDAIARQIGGSDEIRIVPFRGDYYRLAPARAHLARGLIYPVPDPQFPFLGVHFTPRTDGEVWLGPNAVLALGAYAYGKWEVHLGEAIALVRHPGVRRMARRYWRTGLAELMRAHSKSRFLAALQRYVPALRAADLLPGPSGIRAQAVRADGTMLDDFWYESHQRVLVVRNAPSPAATASLALARQIVDRAFSSDA